MLGNIIEEHKPKFLVTYTHNIDRETTYDLLHPIFYRPLGGIEEKPRVSINWDYTGHLKIVWDSTTFLISHGFIQVAFVSPEEKKRAWRFFWILARKGLIMPNKNEQLRIYPVRQTLTIPFPTPQDFKIAWCEFEQTFRNWDLFKRMCITLGLFSIITLTATLLAAYILDIFLF
jgi:hypothetical protein